MIKKFKKILVANRGEIAVRVIRACRDLSISTVAVYSEADADALHVRMADEAFCVGPAPSAESYLRADEIIRIAKETNTDAIHPGYGFLSENADFVRSVSEAGIVFIGPPTKAIEAMGGKITAREIAIEAGVPIVPGNNESVDDPADLAPIAEEIGYPVMLKAAAGGGGKGMRLVRSADELASAYKNARSEAMASFSDDTVYMEKAVVKPRHIEIQVFSDAHGNHVHLGERECSIQRRHQKVVEEAPSPINDADLRQRMGEEAVKVARAVDYVGAGTVEFLLSDVDHSFYFLEMNTRLQVEHPVTELVTGIDLVKEQIRVAEGNELSFKQSDVEISGHAIECRVYAEDAENGFIPSPGKITRLRLPQGNGVRDDGGVYEGSEVSIYYDPMISKLCTYGSDREEAIGRMRRALREYTVSGIKTTIPMFRQIMDDEVFISGKLDTAYLDGFFERISGGKTATDELHAAIAAAALMHRRKATKKAVGAKKTKSRWAAAARRESLNSG